MNDDNRFTAKRWQYVLTAARAYVLGTISEQRFQEICDSYGALKAAHKLLLRSDVEPPPDTERAPARGQEDEAC